MLWLIACHPHEDAAAESSPGTDSATPEDSSTYVAPPFECGDIPSRPDVTSRWTLSGAVTAGGIDSITPTSSGFPVYVGGMTTGAWRADDPSFAWQRLGVMRTHTYAEIGVNEADPTEVFHSSSGVLWRSRDSGATFTELTMGNTGVEGDPNRNNPLLALAVRNEEIYGILMDGTAAYSPDHGDTVELRGKVGTSMETSIHFNRILPPAEEGGPLFFTDGLSLYRSTDAMESWQPIRPDVEGGYSLVRDGSSLLVGTLGGLATSVDDGDTWTETSPGFAVSYATVTQSGHVAVADATTHLTVDGVARTLPALPQFLGHVEDTLLLGTDDGTWVSADLGATWTRRATGMDDTGFSVVAVHPMCQNRLIIGSRCSGGVYTSEDYGATWTHVSQYFHYVMSLTFDPFNVERVWGVSDDVLLRSDDGGDTWTTVYQKYHFHGFAVDPTHHDRLLLGSVADGTNADETMSVYASTDGGETWQDSSAGLPTSKSSAHAIHFWKSDPDIVLLGTYKGGDVAHEWGEGIGLYRSEDGGASWSITALPEVDIAWLAPGPADSIWAGTGGGIYASEDGGVTWTRADGVDGNVVSLAFRGDTGLAYSYSGEVWRTDDAGVSWYSFAEGLVPGSTASLGEIGITADGETGFLTHYGFGILQAALQGADR